MNIPKDGIIICHFDEERFALVELRDGRIAAYLYDSDYDRLVATYQFWVDTAKKMHKRRPAPFKGYFPVQFDDLLSAPQEAVPAGS